MRPESFLFNKKKGGGVTWNKNGCNINYTQHNNHVRKYTYNNLFQVTNDSIKHLLYLETTEINVFLHLLKPL